MNQLPQDVVYDATAFTLVMVLFVLSMVGAAVVWAVDSARKDIEDE